MAGQLYSTVTFTPEQSSQTDRTIAWAFFGDIDSGELFGDRIIQYDCLEMGSRIGYKGGKDLRPWTLCCVSVSGLPP